MQMTFRWYGEGNDRIKLSDIKQIPGVQGIRCNAIAPGFFVTNQNRALLFNEDGTPTARTGKILAATPMKKFGEISDLIGTLMWLADDSASGFVTGTVIPVDGGFSAYSGV